MRTPGFEPGLPAWQADVLTKLDDVRLHYFLENDYLKSFSAQTNAFSSSIISVTLLFHRYLKISTLPI